MGGKLNMERISATTYCKFIGKGAFRKLSVDTKEE